MRFVLVHGGRSSGRAWQPVANVLRSAGHMALCPDLSAPESSSLADHVAQVVATLDSLANKPGPGKIVLAGHSYGGMVISEAGQARAKILQAMVYLDAAVPRPGGSLFDLIREAGFDPVLDYALEPLAPFIQPSNIFWGALQGIPKVFVRCSRSEFNAVTAPIYERLRQTGGKENWRTLSLDGRHKAMEERPQDVAAILLQAAGAGRC